MFQRWDQIVQCWLPMSITGTPSFGTRPISQCSARPFSNVLRAWGLAFRVECEGHRVWCTIGAILDGRRRLVHDKPEKAWRLRGAVQALRLQGYCAEATLRGGIGHVLCLLQPLRPLFSTLSHVLVFIAEHENSVQAFDDFIGGKLRAVAG